MGDPDRIHITTDVGMVGTGRWTSAGLENSFGQPAYLRRDGETLAEVRDCLQACIAMIQHAIGPGRDVFIEPDVKRRLSDARAALAKMGE